MELSEEQRLAVLSPGHALVVASPGSGKTRVLSAKCRHLLETRPGAPIVVVTFTRDAAQELQRRIVNGLKRAPRNILIGTFHLLAKTQLTKARVKVNLLSPGEQMALVRRAWMGVASGIDWEDAVKAIERYKSSLNPVIADAPDGWLFRRYQDLLSQHKAMDFADLLLAAVRGMRDGTIMPLPSSYVLCDEGQDTDGIQSEWVWHHAKAGAILTIVGDDDQSIYGWRGAAGFHRMVAFEREFKAQRFTLSTNYRCARQIVATSDRLIRTNTDRLPKSLQAATQEPGTVEYREWVTRRMEAADVAQTVAKNPDNWAIFARTTRMLDVVETTLWSHKIPYTRFGSRRFWQRPHLANFLASLRSLITSEDLGYEYMLIWCGVSEADVTRLKSEVGAEKIQQALGLVTQASRKPIENLVQHLLEWRHELARPSPRAALVIHGVADWFASVAKDKRQAEDILLAADGLSDLTGSLEDRIRHALYNRKQKFHGGVSVMTLHAAKGLEYPCVYIIGVEEKILPHSDSPVAEERRLMYVGMTRAKEALVLSKGLATATPSRFLVESGLYKGREDAA